MYDLLQDCRQALRFLTNKPGMTALAVLSLALGIGVNTSMFSMVNAVLLRDLPLKAPEEVVEIYTGDSGGFLYATSSYPDFLDLREQNEVMASMMAFRATIATHDNGEDTEILFGEEVSANYFDFLGLEPTVGRGFTAQEEEHLGTAPVVVLSRPFWQKRYGEDPQVLGQTVKLNGLDFTIIGVGPSQLKGTFPGLTAEFWIPLAMGDVIRERPGLERRGHRSIFLKGRLKQGISLDTAQAHFETLAARLGAAYPETNENRQLTLVPASEVALNPGFDGPLFGVAGLLMVIVALVLLIACSNIANLLLARAAGRRQEVAIRLALGAGRGRLIRQLLAESLALAFLGGAAGLLMALWMTRLIVAFQPPLPVPLSLDLGPSPALFAFTLGLALLTGLACGLAPALQSSRPDLVPALKGTQAAPGKSLRRLNLRNALVVVQVMLSTVLLCGSGLFLRSLANAQAVDPGFSARKGALVQMALGLGGRYTEEEGRQFYDQVLERTRALPGVRSAALVEQMPLGFGVQTQGLLPEGQTLEDEEDWPEVDLVTVDGGYFETLGIELRRGRDFDVRASADGPGTVIVNETFAARYWPGEDPLGKRVRFDSEEPWAEVVGVVADGKYRTLGETTRPFIYLPFRQNYSSMMTLVATGEGDEQSLLMAIRQELDSLDANLPIFDNKTLGEHLDIMLFPARLGASLLAGFGLLGLALAAVGLYGVVAFSVARRTREVGIRMAIGADRAAVVTMVVGEGMGLVVVGLFLGLGLAWMGSGVLESLLYGISPSDPLTFALVAVLLASVALVANLVPAGRAARIAPTEALRYE